MSGKSHKWLKDRDVEGIINSQTVILTTVLDEIPHSIKIPRYLVEKHSYLFRQELAAHDISDPAKTQQSIPLSLETWYQNSLPHQIHSEGSRRREWNMLEIFCKWMLCGRIVGEPLLHPKDCPWERSCDPLFNADVAIWILEDTAARRPSNIKYPSDRASRHYAS